MLATVRPMSRAKLAPTEAAQRVHKRLTKYGRTLRLIIVPKTLHTPYKFLDVQTPFFIEYNAYFASFRSVHFQFASSQAQSGGLGLTY